MNYGLSFDMLSDQIRAVSLVKMTNFVCVLLIIQTQLVFRFYILQIRHLLVVSYIRYWTPIPRQTLGAWISRHKCVGSTNQQWSKTTFNPKMTSFITRVVHEDDV